MCKSQGLLEFWVCFRGFPARFYDVYNSISISHLESGTNLARPDRRVAFSVYWKAEQFVPQAFPQRCERLGEGDPADRTPADLITDSLAGRALA